MLRDRSEERWVIEPVAETIVETFEATTLPEAHCMIEAGAKAEIVGLHRRVDSRSVRAAATLSCGSRGRRGALPLDGFLLGWGLLGDAAVRHRCVWSAYTLSNVQMNQNLLSSALFFGVLVRGVEGEDLVRHGVTTASDHSAFRAAASFLI